MAQPHNMELSSPGGCRNLLQQYTVIEVDQRGEFQASQEQQQGLQPG